MEQASIVPLTAPQYDRMINERILAEDGTAELLNGGSARHRAGG
ncbi:MAG TPA: hypothetical protein VN541_05180 [Tepidisphaeraceae bacterium]|nr:hypothetical protein [Tepidisphaeraceae bacterium]